MLRLLDPRPVPRRLWAIFHTADATTVLVLLGLMAIAWGVGLLYPMPTFNLVSFAFIASLAPEDAWGAAAVICGVSQILVVVNGGWRARANMALCDAFFWAFLAAGMALSPGGSPIPVAQFSVNVVFALWGYYSTVKRGARG